MGVITWLEEHRSIARASALVYMCAIFLFSSMSRVPQPDVGFDTSVLAHFLEYAVLGVLLSAALGLEKKRVFVAIFVASLFGVSDELHQFFVPGRVASIYDAATDAAGSAVGAVSAFLLRRRL
jgi:VanZ family protein